MCFSESTPAERKGRRDSGASLKGAGGRLTFVVDPPVEAEDFGCSDLCLGAMAVVGGGVLCLCEVMGEWRYMRGGGVFRMDEIMK